MVADCCLALRRSTADEPLLVLVVSVELLPFIPPKLAGPAVGDGIATAETVDCEV